MTVANGNRAASATWLTGSTFTALALPLALFGAQPLDISLGSTAIRGQLDDYAMQYLGAAAAIGLGLGALRLRAGAAGSSQQAAAMPFSLDATPIELPTLASAQSLLTEDSLKASGLHGFLEADDAPLLLRPAPEVAQPQHSPATASPRAKGLTAQADDENDWLFPEPQPQAQQAQPEAPSAQILPAETLASIVAEVQAIMQQMSAQSQIAAAPQSVAPAQPAQFQTVPTAMAQSRRPQTTYLPLAVQQASPFFPAAQSYVSFARAQTALAQPIARNINAEVAVLDQIYQIRDQMLQLMNQVDLIQANLEQTVYPVQRPMPLRTAQQPSYTVSAAEPIRSATGQMPDPWANNYRAIAS